MSFQKDICGPLNVKCTYVLFDAAEVLITKVFALPQTPVVESTIFMCHLILIKFLFHKMTKCMHVSLDAAQLLKAFVLSQVQNSY